MFREENSTVEVERVRLGLGRKSEARRHRGCGMKIKVFLYPNDTHPASKRNQ